MPAPERHNHDAEVLAPTEPGREIVPVPRLTRTDRTVRWIGWHLGELACVTLPVPLAVGVSPWLASLSVIAGVVWAIRETRGRQ